MIFNYNEKTDITNLELDEEDVCNECNFYNHCPLIGAIMSNIVYPSAMHLIFGDCHFYRLMEEDNETS